MVNCGGQISASLLEASQDFAPILVVQDDAFNKSKINTVIIIPLTTNLALAEAPGNVFAGQEETGLTKDSVLVVSQLSH